MARLTKLFRVALVALTAVIGALFAIGGVLGILFEVQGFGTPPGGARTGYILGQAGQILVALAVPVVVFRIALPEHARWWLVALGGAGAVAVVVALLGLATR